MNTNIDMSKLLVQMTVGELIEALKAAEGEDGEENAARPTEKPVEVSCDKRYVYGIDGIARLFNCSKPTANRIKKSGKINAAITQIGRKIIVDAEKALELAGIKAAGRGSRR